MADQPRALKDKDLKDIRPARGGVKLRQKRPPKDEVRPRPERPPAKVVRNVHSPESPENPEPPTEEAARLISQINRAKQRLVDSMRGFSKLLSDPKLLENRSEREKQEESSIINELISSAQSVESLEPGEGLMSLCVFATRLSLLLRNAGNGLSHKNYLLERRIEQLEDKLGVEPPKEDLKAKEKQFLLEQAKKLGLKINIED